MIFKVRGLLVADHGNWFYGFIWKKRVISIGCFFWLMKNIDLSQSYRWSEVSACYCWKSNLNPCMFEMFVTLKFHARIFGRIFIRLVFFGRIFFILVRSGSWIYFTVCRKWHTGDAHYTHCLHNKNFARLIKGKMTNYDYIHAANEAFVSLLANKAIQQLKIKDQTNCITYRQIKDNHWEVTL